MTITLIFRSIFENLHKTLKSPWGVLNKKQLIIYNRSMITDVNSIYGPNLSQIR